MPPATLQSATSTPAMSAVTDSPASGGWQRYGRAEHSGHPGRQALVIDVISLRRAEPTWMHSWTKPSRAIKAGKTARKPRHARLQAEMLQRSRTNRRPVFRARVRNLVRPEAAELGRPPGFGVHCCRRMARDQCPDSSARRAGASDVAAHPRRADLTRAAAATCAASEVVVVMNSSIACCDGSSPAGPSGILRPAHRRRPTFPRQRA